MRILAACSLGGSGHLDPLVPLLAAAEHQGHETMVVGPPAIEGLVVGAGFTFAPGDEPAEADIAPLRERLPVAPPDEATIIGNRELFGRLAARAMLPAMAHLCREWTPDLVLRDPCEYASAVVAPERGIPAAQVAISLAAAERGSIDAAAPALEEHRPGLLDEVLAMPYLTRFPGSIDPSGFATTVRYSVPPPEPRPLPDWWTRSTAPLVYLTFGTVVGYLADADAVYRAALAAVADLDARVLLTVGRHFDPAGLDPLPANVHVEAWVDHHDAVSAAEVVVCHGGSGTVLGTLAAGVPLVVVPVLGDQFANGEQVMARGAGLTVAVDGSGDGGRRIIGEGDAPRVTAAIEAVLGDPAHRRAATAVATEMAGAPAVDEVVAELLSGMTGWTDRPG